MGSFPDSQSLTTSTVITFLLLLQAQRTKATVPLLKAAKRVILLTGTPALNKPKVCAHACAREMAPLDTEAPLPWLHI